MEGQLNRKVFRKKSAGYPPLREMERGAATIPWSWLQVLLERRKEKIPRKDKGAILTELRKIGIEGGEEASEIKRGSYGGP